MTEYKNCGKTNRQKAAELMDQAAKYQERANTNQKLADACSNAAEGWHYLATLEEADDE